MAIVSSDLTKNLSGGAANADPNASLGGVISSEVITDDSLNNLFAAANAAEALAGSTKYRAFFVKNTHATITAVSAVVYISSNTPSATTAVTIAIADEAVGTDTIETIADEDTAPSGPTFVTADGSGNAVAIGDMAPGEMKGIWVKWVLDASTDAVDDAMTIVVRAETSA